MAALTAANGGSSVRLSSDVRLRFYADPESRRTDFGMTICRFLSCDAPD